MVLDTRRTTPGARSWAAALVLACGTAACTPQLGPLSPAQQVTGAPLSAYDEDGPALAPGDPCTAMAADRVTDALGSEAETSVTWAPGRRVPGTSEVADEYGCRFTAGDVTASAWVFAVPTSPARAGRLAKEATGTTCRRARDTETFGEPGVAFTCRLDTGSTLTGMRGLVGSSWVACEILGTEDTERVGRWCAAVLESLTVG